MQFKIKRLDQFVYYSIWILAVFYCVLCFTRNCNTYFQNLKDDYNDFTNESIWLSRKRDKSDIEWESVIHLLYNYFPWLFVYLFITEMIKCTTCLPKVQQIWQITFIIVFFHYQVSKTFILILFFQPIFFYCARFFIQSTLCTWLCSFLSLLFITLYKVNVLFSEFEPVNEYEIHLQSVSVSWINLKCTSFFLENPYSVDFLNLISYSFYPPTIFTGPFVLYEDFKHTYVTSSRTKERVVKLLKNLLKCVLWYIFGNISLHFVYVSATAYQPQFVERLDYVSLCGYGYAMGQFFHIKYLVQYGFSTSFSSFENVKVPNLPRCIGRVHLYSDMWRYFDPGLYTFLKKHIYFPLVKGFSYKLLASLVCFCFICIWHGLEDYIIIWTVMNYIGIIIEYISTIFYKKHVPTLRKTMSPTAINITSNILASPLLAFSAISNFYFFGGKEIGDIFFKRLFANVFDSMRLLAILYCCCQVSSDLRSIQASKM